MVYSGIADGKGLYAILSQIMELPKHAVECEIRIAINEPVTVKCKYYPIIDGEKFTDAKVVGKYYLMNAKLADYAAHLEETVD